LSVRIGKVRLKNPVLTASGTCGYGLEYAPYVDLSRLGAFVTKSITREERAGNPPERIVETPGGLLNAIGLANVGLERFIVEKAPELAKLGTAVFVNVAGHSIDDYVEVCGRIDDLCAEAVSYQPLTQGVKGGPSAISHQPSAVSQRPVAGAPGSDQDDAIARTDRSRRRPRGTDATLYQPEASAMVDTNQPKAPARECAAASSIVGIELNVGCPNVSDGLVFGTDAAQLRELVAAVRSVVRRGVLVVKLSPNVTDIAATARAAVEGGADALAMVNTFLGMAIDVRTRRPKLANRSGGLSGPAIRPMAVYLVHRVWREVARGAGVPIIGMGGVASWEDAVEFMLAGASAVAVGTALFVDPTAPVKIVDGLQAYLGERGLGGVAELVGGMTGEGETPKAES
jgi:dihydroorotate dehydrogenase